MSFSTKLKKNQMGLRNIDCFLWFKDTKMKANHNLDFYGLFFLRLFPMVQRY